MHQETTIQASSSASPIQFSFNLPGELAGKGRQQRRSFQALKHAAWRTARELIETTSNCYPLPPMNVQFEGAVSPDIETADHLFEEAGRAVFEGFVEAGLIQSVEQFVEAVGDDRFAPRMAHLSSFRVIFDVSAAPQLTTSEKDLQRQAASYLGGHPLFIKRDKSGGSIRLTTEAFEYSGVQTYLRIPVVKIVGATLGTFQPGVIRRILVDDSRVLADVRNTLLLDFIYYGTQYQAEFHIEGALTVPGEAEKAREMLNALNSLRAKFHVRPATQASAQAALPTVAERLRELKQLLDDGVITSAQFEGMKAQLLNDL